MTKWTPSLCFRRFRNKHTELSELYWTQALAFENLKTVLRAADPNENAVMATGSPFAPAKYPHTALETLNSLDGYLDRARLHLLVICSANLEAYLQDITLLHLVSLGYTRPDNDLELNEVGKAVGAPILNKDSLPEPLKYAQHLFGINYGSHLNTWIRAYKLRCQAAHDGGVVTARTKKEIPDLRLAIDEMIALSWDELRGILASAEEIATITDQKVSTYALKKVEVRRLLQGLKEQNTLPVFKNRKEIWSFIFQKYRLFGLSNEDQEEIERRYLSH